MAISGPWNTSFYWEKYQKTRGVVPEGILVAKDRPSPKERPLGYAEWKKLRHDGMYLGCQLARLREKTYQAQWSSVRGGGGEHIPNGTEDERTDLVWTQPPSPPYQFLQNRIHKGECLT